MFKKSFSLALIFALLVSVSSVDAFAQQQPNLAAQFARDHQAIWTAPFKIKRGDVKWLVPLTAGAAALVATGADWKVSQNMHDMEGLRGPSRFVSNLGGGGPMMAASGAMLGIGKLTKNDKAAETGTLALQAVLHTELLVGGIKVLVNRERPEKIDGQGGFWGGGRSFPSGHAATTFAFATVVADKYESKWVKVVAYGLATAVSLSRVGGMKHFPSDVLIGGVIGHLVGKYILKRNRPEIH